ncbi:MAG: response regulator transcription factor, partial [Anaerovoracaceae bacterium]
MKILIVEDEIRLARALEKILQDEKYIVDMVHTGLDGLDYAILSEYDCILLDVMLPGMSGFDVARNIRIKKIQTPIIMLTAKNEIEDKIKGLDIGADDYITKPFDPKELLARVRAITRRKGEVIVDVLEFGDLVLNLEKTELSCKGKDTILNFKEFEILKILINNFGKTISKNQL